MSIYGWIYLGIIASGMLIAVAFIAYKSKKQSEIKRKYFDEDKLQEYKTMLANSMERYGISESDDLSEITKKMNLKVIPCKRSDMPKGYDGRISDQEIRIATDLSVRQTNSVLAHEIAHYMSKEVGVCESGCKVKTILPRQGDEQVCDYIASMILISNSELKQELKKSKYDLMRKSKRMQFVADLADKKNISTFVVMKRIADLQQ